MSTILLITVALPFAIAAGYVFWQSIEPQDIWSVGLIEGAPPTFAERRPTIPTRPLITAADVSDAPALFVADPFLLQAHGSWWIFFEYLNLDSGRGEIACSRSTDGRIWTYDRSVLREPFHLSYPYVFEYDGAHYMIPETGEACSVRLYRAVRFPHEWVLVKELLHGHYLDSSILRTADGWWLFAMRDGHELTLHRAAALEGPWQEHPSSPLPAANGLARPGGRVLKVGERYLRFAQDSRRTYGWRLFAYEILSLTETHYQERSLGTGPLFAPAGHGWNAHGMHHADPVRLPNGTWRIAIDGKRIRVRFNWRRGVRTLLTSIGLRARAKCK